MFQDLINDTVSHYSDGQWQTAVIISTVIIFSSLLLHMIIFIVVLNAVAIALMTFEPIRRIGVSLFASAGVAGIILGFAAQKLIGNVLWLVEKPFQNWTRVSADILGTVPLDKLREELTRILESDPKWDRKVNVLQVTDSTEKTMEIRALMSAADSPSAWDLRVNVREKLIDFLQKNYPESLPRSRLVFSKSQEAIDEV